MTEFSSTVLDADSVLPGPAKLKEILAEPYKSQITYEHIKLLLQISDVLRSVSEKQANIVDLIYQMMKDCDSPVQSSVNENLRLINSQLIELAATLEKGKTKLV